MKTLAVSFFILGLGLFFAAFNPHSGTPKVANSSEGYPGFAVVELFTSEGCSSCPSADKLAARIQKEYADKPVYILAFHVDYWNRLGWKDVFSDPAFTKRQRQYASLLKLSSVYTPQAVVDGRTEFVGSQEATMRKAIAEALARKVYSTILLENVKSTGELVSVNYKINGPITNSSLILTLVQKTAESKVRSGENAGRTLSHVQITRAIQTVNLNGKASGTGQISIPAGVKTAGLEVIALLQNNESGEIIAADKSVLEPRI
ncbi:DUF1223 domain-containing protein [Dyadobacter arcticus]|uniref:DUF1223 domain-containing protein n=1 Tax=Dyadobacter arcticus TaxID=1078754 RepID=A0ABX0UHK7_9BACT|nr:DUF1223 domain-containing protein [Dyadobacter arcticus]NIJ52252.1 hypothetical protein [Dyadobacter arcticus]